nr:hypothetical protein [Nocardioides daejeonensis]
MQSFHALDEKHCSRGIHRCVSQSHRACSIQKQRHRNDVEQQAADHAFFSQNSTCHSPSVLIDTDKLTLAELAAAFLVVSPSWFTTDPLLD